VVYPEDLILLLSDLVNFDTTINPTTNTFPTKDCADYISKFGQQNGYSILNVPNCWHLDDNKKIHEVFPAVLYKQGPKKGPKILFLGHIDVVPAVEAELAYWDSLPFNAKVINDRLFGRGSLDMKGGVAAFLYAFKDLEIQKGTIIIALSGDEEIGGMGSCPRIIEELQANNLVPDFVLNAEGSGNYSLVTMRRGGTQIEFNFPLQKNVTKGMKKKITFKSIEGTGSDTLHSMAFLLGSDIHAMILAGKFTMANEALIRMVHSSSTKTNAVPKEVTVEYIDTSDEQQEVDYYEGLSRVMNSLASIGSVNWPIIPSKFGPSICPNLIEIDENSSIGKITFDIRSMLKDPDSHEVIRKILIDHFNHFGMDVQAKTILAIDPVNTDPKHEFPQLVKHLAEQEGIDIVSVGEKLGGASDTRFFTSLGIPSVELGPIGQNGHGPNEAVDLDSMMKLIKIYQKLYLRLCQ
jgi:succinyl-diaminopimelate desuccinylase